MSLPIPDLPMVDTSARILIVDDEEANIALVRRILEPHGYDNLEAVTDPRRGLELVEEYRPDLILLDIVMPHMDGFEFLESLSELVPEEDFLPVLVLTSDHSHTAKRRALSEGASDFLIKPLSPAEVRLRVRNLLRTRCLHLKLREQNVLLEDQNLLLEHRVRQRTRDLEEARLDILRRLARAAEYRDDLTGEHTRRVGRSAAALGRHMGLDEEFVEELEIAAPLHDVGKIGVPDAVLLCPRRLEPDEFEVMKRHTVIGEQLLAGGKSTLLARAAEIALTHHERWDGGGYPRSLAGDEIPLSGRIVAVADTFDALTHARPYKEAWSVERAMQELDRNRKRQFDPDVVAAFHEIVTGLLEEEESAA